MQLGLSSYTFPWSVGLPGFEPPQKWGLNHLIKRVQHHQMALLQIGDNLPFDQIPESEKQGLKALIQAGALRFELGTRGIQAGHLQNYIRLAAEYGAKILRVVIDTAHHEPSVQETLDLIGQSLPHLSDHGVQLAIENHDRFGVDTLVFLVKELGFPQVGICLDTVNSYGAGENLQTVVETLAPYTLNLHIKDYTIRRVWHKMGFEVLGAAAGQGQMNLPWVLEKIMPHGICQTAILEHWPIPQAQAFETIQLEMDWEKQSLTYLKTIFNNHNWTI
jgi:3-oxoisoapionate decarboxylase